MATAWSAQRSLKDGWHKITCYNIAFLSRQDASTPGHGTSSQRPGRGMEFHNCTRVECAPRLFHLNHPMTLSRFSLHLWQQPPRREQQACRLAGCTDCHSTGTPHPLTRNACTESTHTSHKNNEALDGHVQRAASRGGPEVFSEAPIALLALEHKLHGMLRRVARVVIMALYTIEELHAAGETHRDLRVKHVLTHGPTVLRRLAGAPQGCGHATRTSVQTGHVQCNSAPPHRCKLLDA